MKFKNRINNIFFKNRTAAILSIISLVTGIISFLLLILYARYELRYDSFHRNSRNIYLVGQTMFDEQSGTSESVASTSGILAPTLVKDFNEVKYAVRTKEVTLPLISGQQSFVEEGLYADKDFFKIFSFNVKSGNPDTFLENPFSIVLSESLASKLFGDDDPVGNPVEGENGTLYTVTGVFKDTPLNTHFRFDFLISFKTMYTIRDDIDVAWAIMNYKSYILLNENVTMAIFENKMESVVKKYHDRFSLNRQYFLIPLREIHTTTDINIQDVKTVNKQTINICVILAIIILSLACINYINIVTASLYKRIDDITLKQILGAGRMTLILESIAETILITLVSLVISLSLMKLMAPLIENFTGSGLWTNPLFNVDNIIVFLCVFILTVFLAGIYPALLISSINFSDKQNHRLVPGADNTKSNSTKWLTLLQIGASIMLVTVTITLTRQLNFIMNNNIGYDRGNVLVFKMWDKTIRDNADLIKAELLNNPLIKSAALANSLPLKKTERNDITVRNDNGEKVLLPMVTTYFIDDNYIELLQIPFRSGRNFSMDFPSELSRGIIVNEAFVRQSGISDPVGAKVIKWGTEYEIVGVVGDFNYTSLREQIEPLIFSYNPGLAELFLVKVTGIDVDRSISFIESVVSKFSNNSVFDYSLLEDNYISLYKSEKTLGQIFVSFSIIAIILAILGSYNLISFFVIHSRKQIGIRKAMGATSELVFMNLVKKFLKPVFLAIILFSPVAFFLSSRWLMDFSYHIKPGLGIITVSVLFNLIIVFITIFAQTLVAARANPVESLRGE